MEKEYVLCPECGKQLAKKSLHSHMTVHTGVKKYVCPTCGKKYSYRTGLNIHMRSHTGEKPYSCSVCDAPFAQQSSLTFHMQVHTQHRQFECHQCNKTFTRKYDLKRHRTRKCCNLVITHSCGSCQAEFENRSKLEEHSVNCEGSSGMDVEDKYTVKEDNSNSFSSLKDEEENDNHMISENMDFSKIDDNICQQSDNLQDIAVDDKKDCAKISDEGQVRPVEYAPPNFLQEDINDYEKVLQDVEQLDSTRLADCLFACGMCGIVCDSLQNVQGHILSIHSHDVEAEQVTETTHITVIEPVTTNNEDKIDWPDNASGSDKDDLVSGMVDMNSDDELTMSDYSDAEAETLNNDRTTEAVVTIVVNINGKLMQACKVCGELYQNYTDLRLHFDKVHKLPTVLSVKLEKDSCESSSPIMSAHFSDNFNTSQENISHADKVTENKNCVSEEIVAPPMDCAPSESQLDKQKELNENVKHIKTNDRTTRRKQQLITRPPDNHEPYSETDVDAAMIKAGDMWKCGICGQILKTKKYLKQHVLVHKGHRPYTCSVCGFSFAQKTPYNKHMKVHSGVRDIVCELCGKAFAVKRMLNQHMESHKNQNEFLCHICSRSFKSKRYLTDHLRYHEKGHQYKCDICLKDFRRPSELSKHSLKCQKRQQNKC